jgi:hypothetical protein
VIASLTLAFVLGMLAGAAATLIVGYRAVKKQRAQTYERVLLVDEDFEWNHPDVAKLIMGSRPIRQMH